MNLQDAALWRQGNVEQLLAATAYSWPLYTLKNAGWLKPDIIRDASVRLFWAEFLDRVTPEMTDEDAQAKVIEIALQEGIYNDLSKWGNNIVGTPMPQAYANEITNRAYLVDVIAASARLQSALVSYDVQAAREAVKQLADISMSGAAALPDAYDAADRFEAALSTRTVRTGILPIDYATGGIERQALTVLAARPSIGKTALAWQIAREIAERRHKVIFFSLEMSVASLWARAACAMTGILWRDVKAGKIDAEGMNILRQNSHALADIYGEYLTIIDTPQSTASMWQLVANAQPDLIIADHLSKFTDEHRSEVKRLGIITSACKDIAKHVDCAFLLCAQLNRGLEARTDKRPTLVDLRDSGEIEQDADVVMMMHRDDLTNPDTWVFVRKNRDAPLADINLTFNLREQKFERRQR